MWKQILACKRRLPSSLPIFKLLSLFQEVVPSQDCGGQSLPHLQLAKSLQNCADPQGFKFLQISELVYLALSRLKLFWIPQCLQVFLRMMQWQYQLPFWLQTLIWASIQPRLRQERPKSPLAGAFCRHSAMYNYSLQALLLDSII